MVTLILRRSACIRHEYVSPLIIRPNRDIEVGLLQTSTQLSRGSSFLLRARTTFLACVPNTWWAICLQATLGIQILLCAAFEAQIALQEIALQEVFEQGNEYPLATTMVHIQLATVVFETCYQLVLGFNAVRTRNIVTVIGICINNITVLLFAILAVVGIAQELVLWQDVESITMASSDLFKRGFGGLVGSLALCSLAISLITYKLYEQFAW